MPFGYDDDQWADMSPLQREQAEDLYWLHQEERRKSDEYNREQMLEQQQRQQEQEQTP